MNKENVTVNAPTHIHFKISCPECEHIALDAMLEVTSRYFYYDKYIPDHPCQCGSVTWSFDVESAGDTA